MLALGVDVGTTACKAVLLDESAQVLTEADHPHDLTSAYPGWAEEDPRDWWRGMAATARRVLAGRDPSGVAAVGISGMVPALVLLDGEGRPVRPSIQQNDARAVEEIRYFRELIPNDQLFPRTGATWNQQVIPPKLRWVRQHEPDAWRQVRRVCGSYEYVTSLLTGAVYAEANWALESGMWDALAEDWLTPVLDVVDLPSGALPPVRRAHDFVGEINSDPAEEIGLRAGTPVVAGSADHIAAALAAGLSAEGEAVLKLGGAGDFLYAVGTFQPLPELFIDYHDLPGLFVLNGCMATSGSLVKWFKDRFQADASYADLDSAASGIPPGSDGLVLLPYFLGEKTPLHDPEARGTLLGLTLSHTPDHIYRAILEGVAFAFRHHVDVLEAAGHSVRRFSVVDGGARSRLWRQIIASVLGTEVRYPEGGHSSSAYGVAFVAGVAAGLWPWSRCLDSIRIAEVTSPDATATRLYADAYVVFRETYRRLKDLYPRLRQETSAGRQRSPTARSSSSPRSPDVHR